MKLNLQYFAGGHSVTLYKDAGASAFTASADSDVAKDAEVTLTVTLASGYEVKEYEVIAGGVTVNASTKKFTMGNENVVIYLKTQKNNLYVVTEDTVVNINGTETSLAKNVKVTVAANGAPSGATVTPAEVSIDAATIAQLVKAGILVKV